MTTPPIYLTAPQPKPLPQTLSLYIDTLDKKISTAKWKQNLILKYNYMPLQTAKQKIEQQTQRYIRKLQILEEKMEGETGNSVVERQVGEFREFQGKLRGKIGEIQGEMARLGMEMVVLRAAVQEKRDSLKMLIKENVNLNKFIIQESGKRYAETPSDTKAKTPRQSLNPKPRNHPYTYTHTHTHTERSQKHSQKSASTTTKIPISQTPHFSPTADLYTECVDSIIKSIRNMNGSQDVQAGIYLEIMNRKMQARMPTYSLRSKACDVLMDRYRDLRGRGKGQGLGGGQEDFCMGLQTFLGLNWKQIMGIILVKDRNATKLRQLLRICQQAL